MPKHRQSDEPGGGPDEAATRRPTRRLRRRRRHLYLVLEDWQMGYSIRKIDDPASICHYAGLEPLPRPIYQLEAPHGFATCFTASLGSRKIMVAHHKHTEAQTFDLRSRHLVYGPRPHGFPHRRPTFIPVGDNRLCTLWGGSLQLLHLHESASDDDLMMWSWRKLHDLPFDEGTVTSYAVHPNGQNIYVGVEEGDQRFAPSGLSTTYCFDVDHQSTDCVLQATFSWGLPFDGRGYFVDELNAWVGLCRYYNSHGHLCACPDLNPDSKSWKIGKEDLFSKTQVEMHLSATLVYMGDTEFCLVERVRVYHSYLCEGDPLNPQPFDFLLQFKDSCIHPLLKLTMFSVMVDENGELTTGDTRRFKYYYMPGPFSRSSSQCPVAFWM